MIDLDKARARMRMAGILQRMGLDEGKILRAVDYPAVHTLTVNTSPNKLIFQFDYKAPRSGKQAQRPVTVTGGAVLYSLAIGRTALSGVQTPLALNAADGGIDFAPMTQVELNDRSTVTYEDGGIEFDGRVAIINSGTAEDGIDVGWGPSRQLNTGYISVSFETNFIGPEIFTINLAAIRDTLGLSTVDIRVRGNWHISKNTGNVLAVLEGTSGSDFSTLYNVQTFEFEQDVDGEDMFTLTLPTAGETTATLTFYWEASELMQLSVDTGQVASYFPLFPAPHWPAPEWAEQVKRSDNIFTEEPPKL